ncbi:MAG: hypothetical protein ACM34K_04635 [Bacillota bacterium]
MWKVKTYAIITLLLGLISIGWVVYDYLALTDIVYTSGIELAGKLKYVTLGFIPIILFHFAFFATMYFLFDYLKKQKPILAEYKQMKLAMGNMQNKLEKDKNKAEPKEIPIKDVKEGNKPAI